ncbi:MAG TPA: DUF6600 domain-containing protein [Terriglobales bacterium]|nr:DUF6600 domain-containing protein [Terriglobales bacterium]
MIKARTTSILCLSAAVLIAVMTLVLSQFAAAQNDQYDDPPDRVARLGYMQGSISMQPAGESEWVGAVPNRPITTGDKIWADQDSRAEVELGSAVIRLAPNTGFSFLNLDDRTTQIELTSGSLSIRVRRLDRNDLFEIDTPNLAFSVYQPGNYRIDASDDGTYTVVSVRNGEGESTGNGQTYTLHAGQRGTFSGTDSLNAEVVDIGGPDQFDNWVLTRDRRYDDSRSARYVSPDVVGYEDLDEYGDWRDDPNYGHVWYPSRVDSGWAPYQTGHWDWISPWGWTWVDDAPWGYAPFHYGRWVTVGGRWGWVAGPVAVRPVYAPALVVFIGGGGGFGANVGWFPLGPREVYVPSYRVSRGYVDRVNVTNTNVNVTNITNVYNTTIINKTTNVTNVTYVNRSVRGAVTAVPQRTFVSAQPVARAKVVVNERDISAASLTTRVAVAPTRESVLGARANTVNQVTAPPQRIRDRQVVAKAAPPPPPVPFARQQAELQKNPGQPLAKREVQNLRPAAAPESHPMVKVAPPGKPATPNGVRPGNQPNQSGNQQRAGRPDQPNNPSANRPGEITPAQPAGNTPNPATNRTADQPRPNDRPTNDRLTNDRQSNDRLTIHRQNNDRPNNNRPGAANPAPADRPGSAQPNQPNARPEQPARNDRQPDTKPNDRPQPPARTDRPTDTRPNDRPQPPVQNDRQPDTRPNDRPQPPAHTDRPTDVRPNDRPQPPAHNDRQPDAKPNNRPEPPARSDQQPDAKPNNRPEPPAHNDRPPDARPNRPEPAEQNRANRPPQQQSRPETPEEKQQRQKQEREQQKHDEKPPSE